MHKFFSLRQLAIFRKLEIQGVTDLQAWLGFCVCCFATALPMGHRPEILGGTNAFGFSQLWIVGQRFCDYRVAHVCRETE
jgi:hypothetical protein